MALLDATGQPVPDPWAWVGDGEPVPADRSPIVTPARLKAEGVALAGRDQPLGVRLASHEGAETLEAFLPALSLVAVEFPKFRDGRGFTTARSLRERFGFTGDVRAFGHVLPDQYTFLVRCGFSTVALREGQEADAWRTALGLVTVTYQRAQTGANPVSLLRRRFGAGAGS